MIINRTELSGSSGSSSSLPTVIIKSFEGYYYKASGSPYSYHSQIGFDDSTHQFFDIPRTPQKNSLASGTSYTVFYTTKSLTTTMTYIGTTVTYTLEPYHIYTLAMHGYANKSESNMVQYTFYDGEGSNKTYIATSDRVNPTFIEV